MSTQSERRRTIRIRVEGRLIVTSEGSDVPLTLIDVGQGGFSVLSPQQLPLNVAGQYLFSTADRSWSDRLAARAVYCTRQVTDNGQPAFHVGFSFVQPDAAATERKVMALMDRATSITFQ